MQEREQELQDSEEALERRRLEEEERRKQSHDMVAESKWRTAQPLPVRGCHIDTVTVSFYVLNDRVHTSVREYMHDQLRQYVE